MSAAGLFAHLSEGAAHVCQAWSVVRRDGKMFGFTDHDRPLTFEGLTFRPDSGLTARALANGTGLAVDNTEAVGLLQSDAISDADIVAGRFDGAEVTNWLVRWDRPADRSIRFRGHIGEITRQGGQFHAELRGLAEGLNRPVGRSFLRSCSAVLGDRACRVDLNDPRLYRDATVVSQSERRIIRVDIEDILPRWFEQGTLAVLSGKAEGLKGQIKHHDTSGARHKLTLWDSLRGKIKGGDRVRLIVGCDRRAETCRQKFANFGNFQGFPHIPGEDWLVSVPRSGDVLDGGSRTR